MIPKNFLVFTGFTGQPTQSAQSLVFEPSEHWITTCLYTICFQYFNSDPEPKIEDNMFRRRSNRIRTRSNKYWFPLDRETLPDERKGCKLNILVKHIHQYPLRKSEKAIYVNCYVVIKFNPLKWARLLKWRVTSFKLFVFM